MAAMAFVRAQSSMLWHGYVGALERRPLLTKIATGQVDRTKLARNEGACAAATPPPAVCADAP
jgi:hypothetical protein